MPAAVVFDLGRGGDFGARPDAGTGAAAVDAAHAGAVEQGVVGAGTGALVGGLKGGVGSASAVLDSGATVAALVVVNAVGSAVDPVSGQLHGARVGLPGEFPAGHRDPGRAGRAARRGRSRRRRPPARPPRSAWSPPT